MRYFFSTILTCIGFLTTRILTAEIQSVGVTWEAAVCLSTCIPLLEKNLRAIQGTQDIQFNPHSGRAVMKWDPNIPFRYEPFNLAFRLTGVSNTDIRVRVRGKLTHNGRLVYLITPENGSRFQIIGPAIVIPNQYNISDNIDVHPLSNALLTSLLGAEEEDKSVIIEGSLFQPERYALILIAEQVKFQKEENEENN